MQPPSPTQAVLLPYILMLFADVCPSPPQTRTRCWILSTAIYAPEARPVPAIARYAGFPLQPRPNLVTKSNHHRQNPVPLLTDPSPSPSRLQLQKRDVGLTKLRTELEQSEARRQELEFELCLARERQQQLQVCWGEGGDLVLRQFDNTPPSYQDDLHNATEKLSRVSRETDEWSRRVLEAQVRGHLSHTHLTRYSYHSLFLSLPVPLAQDAEQDELHKVRRLTEALKSQLELCEDEVSGGRRRERTLGDIFCSTSSPLPPVHNSAASCRAKMPS